MNSFVDRLVKLYDPSTISEGKYIKAGEPGSRGEMLSNGEFPDTSYVINKGEQFVMCLRDTNGNFHDMTLLKFVALHEISHIGSYVDQHEEEFWSNFKWLLTYTQRRGIYRNIDYSQSPVRYCGSLLVNSNPYYDNGIRMIDDTF